MKIKLSYVGISDGCAIYQISDDAAEALKINHYNSAAKVWCFDINQGKPMRGAIVNISHVTDIANKVVLIFQNGANAECNACSCKHDIVVYTSSIEVYNVSKRFERNAENKQNQQEPTGIVMNIDGIDNESLCMQSAIGKIFLRIMSTNSNTFYYYNDKEIDKDLYLKMRAVFMAGGDAANVVSNIKKLYKDNFYKYQATARINQLLQNIAVMEAEINRLKLGLQ